MPTSDHFEDLQCGRAPQRRKHCVQRPTFMPATRRRCHRDSRLTDAARSAVTKRGTASLSSADFCHTCSPTRRPLNGSDQREARVTREIKSKTRLPTESKPATQPSRGRSSASPRPPHQNRVSRYGKRTHRASSRPDVQARRRADAQTTKNENSQQRPAVNAHCLGPRRR